MGPRMAGPEINHRSAGPSAGGAPAGPPDSAASALSKAADGAWRNLIEFAGEVRTLRSFPWFTWAKHDHDVDFDEILPALSLIESGDIGLHRNRGHLSNLAIPGFMKHAWIHVRDGIEDPAVVEALTTGVVKRSPIYPLHSDYSMILSPRNLESVTDEHRSYACDRAHRVIGAKYDPYFTIDLPSEPRDYNGCHHQRPRSDRQAARWLLKGHRRGFSCTEMVSYCWWHQRENLTIRHTTSRGLPVILPDSFLNRNWKISWMSRSTTVDQARAFGLHEEGLSLIEEYLLDEGAMKDDHPAHTVAASH